MKGTLQHHCCMLIFLRRFESGARSPTVFTPCCLGVIRMFRDLNESIVVLM